MGSDVGRSLHLVSCHLRWQQQGYSLVIISIFIFLSFCLSFLLCVCASRSRLCKFNSLFELRSCLLISRNFDHDLTFLSSFFVALIYFFFSAMVGYTISFAFSRGLSLLDKVEIFFFPIVTTCMFYNIMYRMCSLFEILKKLILLIWWKVFLAR